MSFHIVPLCILPKYPQPLGNLPQPMIRNLPKQGAWSIFMQAISIGCLLLVTHRARGASTSLSSSSRRVPDSLCITSLSSLVASPQTASFENLGQISEPRCTLFRASVSLYFFLYYLRYALQDVGTRCQNLVRVHRKGGHARVSDLQRRRPTRIHVHSVYGTPLQVLGYVRLRCWTW